MIVPNLAIRPFVYEPFLAYSAKGPADAFVVVNGQVLVFRQLLGLIDGWHHTLGIGAPEGHVAWTHGTMEKDGFGEVTGAW